MEVTVGHCEQIESNDLNSSDGEETPLHVFEMETLDSDRRRSFCIDQQFDSMDALEILREAVRILRYDNSAFMLILFLLICPLSAISLSNLLLDQSMAKSLSTKLMLVGQSSGLPMKPLIKKLCISLSEMTVSFTFSLPFYVTFSLLSKASTVYAVDCTYLRTHFHNSKFFAVIGKIWKRLLWTYLSVCMLIISCIALFLIFVIGICNVFSFLGFPPQMITYPFVVVGLVFVVIFANAIIICKLSIVISILEDISGRRAILKSSSLIQGQIQVGLLISFGSMIGLAFVEGLYDHRVNTVSYGDGSSRLWEGPLLVFMYSFIVLIDHIMSAVFYFICKSSSSMETSEKEDQALVAAMIPSA
ncbi:hypothetical protein MKW92_040630 [Papaver armeniacum]|nr:hypothetical protein MKW92_040630 [Papaver armeniacum]